MFPETKDILIILLVVLAAVLAVLVFLLILKRRQVRKTEAAGPAPEQPAAGGQAPPEAGGPSDAAAIKASIISEGEGAGEVAEQPEGEASKPKADSGLVEIDESSIQEGVEPGDALIKPPPELEASPRRKPKRPPKEPEGEEAEEKPHEDVEFVEMDEYAEPVKTRKVVRVGPEGGIEIQRPAEPKGGGRAGAGVPEAVETGAKPVRAKASQIDKSNKSFHGKTVVIEGSLKLSSTGKNDTWYVIFDDSGSAVVRSASEIPYASGRITARVEKTRMGQVYLDVIKSEKL